MDFTEMKKIWDSQNNELYYGINEDAMHKMILSKKGKAFRISNISELLMILAYTGAGIMSLFSGLKNQNENIWLILLGAWMILSGVYIFNSRLARLKVQSNLDRTMLGDLNHAIQVATYQVRISWFGRWNTLPIGLFIVLSIWNGGQPAWIVLIFVLFILLTIYASGWEHRFYRSRKQELEVLKQNLESE